MELKEAKQQSLKESERLEKEIVEVQELKEEEDCVENKNEVERYLVDGCKDLNNDKLNILG